MEVRLIDKEKGWQQGFSSLGKRINIRTQELGLRTCLLCLNQDVLDPALSTLLHKSNILTLNYLLSALPKNNTWHIAEFCAANLSKPGVVLINDHGSEEMRDCVEALGTLIKSYLPQSTVYYHFSSSTTQCVILN